MARRRKRFWFEVGFVLTALAVGVGFSLKPWRAYGEQRKVRDEYVDEMNRSDARIEELVRQRARAESPLGREELARKQGYRRPNELPIEGD